MKRYGGIVSISPECLMEVLGLKGKLLGVENDYFRRTVNLVIEGGLGEYPEVPEGEKPPELQVRVDVGRKPYPKSSRPVLKVALVDLDGNEYVHYDKEGEDSENNKKEEKTKENKE